MEQIFKVKIRRIGSSVGVLIPKRMIKQNKIKMGDEVEMVLLKKNRIDAIEKAMGIAKGAGPFRRENSDRI